MEAMQNFEENNPKTYEKIDIKAPAKAMFERYGLEENTIDFIGHAVALYTDESFMNKPAI